jgi:hypothetical protein
VWLFIRGEGTGNITHAVRRAGCFSIIPAKVAVRARIYRVDPIRASLWRR